MPGKRPDYRMIAWALAAVLAGCSGTGPAKRDPVDSEIRSARSFAAESELLVEFVLAGRATRPYAVAHAAYLEEAIRQSADEPIPAAQPGAADVIRECRTD